MRARKLVASLQSSMNSLIQEVVAMRATFLLAATAAGVFAMSPFAQAQDMQMSPAQGSAAQQSAQDSSTATNDSSYGGATATHKSGSASRDAWPVSTSQLCTPGLSCNIYNGQ
jgi:hypothetical protein